MIEIKEKSSWSPKRETSCERCSVESNIRPLGKKEKRAKACAAAGEKQRKNKCDKQTWFLEWIGSGNLVEGIKFAIGKHKTRNGGIQRRATSAMFHFLQQHTSDIQAVCLTLLLSPKTGERKHKCERYRFYRGKKRKRENQQ